MIELLRYIRGVLNSFSRMEVLGLQVDFVFHFAGAFVLTWMLLRRFSFRVAARLTVGVLLVKELSDVLGRSRLEYIRPPGWDSAVDLTFGLAGVALAYLMVRKTRKIH